MTPKERTNFINSTCKWLSDHMQNYAFPIYEGEDLTDKAYIKHNLITDLRKYLETL